jgi:hypothetical protein
MSKIEGVPGFQPVHFMPHLALNVKLKRQALTIEEKKEYNRKKNEKLRMYRAKAKKKKEEKKKEDC